MKTSSAGIAGAISMAASLALSSASCSSTGQLATGAGDPCTPSVEKTPGFTGFDEHEVTVETGNAQCISETCLVNHFRGRVTPGGAVRAQCTDRPARDTVYCSCRCGNIEGKTDDGAAYCGCPSGFACTQLVTSIGQKNDTTSGAYCVKAGTAYDPNSACAATQP